jgi:hypothetical protein
VLSADFGLYAAQPANSNPIACVMTRVFHIPRSAFNVAASHIIFRLIAHVLNLKNQQDIEIAETIPIYLV